MRVLAIGDIHGCLRAFDLVLDMVLPQPDDLLVTLGDYVDRGPDSFGVLDRLIDLRFRCNLVALRGNHDQMMLDARNGPEPFKEWLHCGGKQALRSYSDHPVALSIEDVPSRHWHFLEATCVKYHETDTHVFVHANLYADMPLDEQPDHMLMWERLVPEDSRPHESGKTMVCGHTQQLAGAPLNLGHAVCIDTWAYGDGWLTCLDVRTGRYWQANQAGESRAGELDEPAEPQPEWDE